VGSTAEKGNIEETGRIKEIAESGVFEAEDEMIADRGVDEMGEVPLSDAKYREDVEGR
jgi:hypothetical protein